MSNLLKEAIVDAKALREAALKSAETTIVEKYSEEVRQTLEKLLEQDDLAADPMADTGEAQAEGEEVVKDLNLAATDDLDPSDGSGLKDLPSSGEEVEVTVSLDALQEAVAALEAELAESEEIEINEQDIVDMLSEDDDEEELEEAKGEKGDADPLDGERAKFDKDHDGVPDGADKDKDDPDIKEESLDLDSIVDAITEKLEVDMGAELTGWAGASQEYMKHEMEREMASRRSTDLEEELEDLKKAQEELVFENSQLNESLTQYKQATTELKESLQNVNLSNARLLYTNRVLRNTSLNERQKETIVEAISKAGSVTEARTIFDTLQSTAEAKPKKSPQSLSEAINRNRSSVIRASRHTEKTNSDPFQERMKRLAGIK